MRRRSPLIKTLCCSQHNLSHLWNYTYCISTICCRNLFQMNIFSWTSCGRDHVKKVQNTNKQDQWSLRATPKVYLWNIFWEPPLRIFYNKESDRISSDPPRGTLIVILFGRFSWVVGWVRFAFWSPQKSATTFIPDANILPTLLNIWLCRRSKGRRQILLSGFCP